MTAQYKKYLTCQKHKVPVLCFITNQAAIPHGSVPGKSLIFDICISDLLQRLISDVKRLVNDAMIVNYTKAFALAMNSKILKIQDLPEVAVRRCSSKCVFLTLIRLGFLRESSLFWEGEVKLTRPPFIFQEELI